ncbi:hypothetical protein ANCCEY_01954 [Ancylostoma ceylanicum]|uniref:Wiskott-Aldrich syndrome protein family member n=2 Tax=Ancylostoma ceylanicum TaxID=53326 RepID=A0A8I3B384_9BILA|nr:hypothetical protein ANCCEY_01954 [Ancylostoma ceylanicum]EYC24630.1 hypothetical protein Y032_0013g2015 [Ancylostoma ceylanicum]
MPLIKRAVSPVDVSRVKIPPEVTNGELQYVANSSLANLIRQLSSISKHAEHIFGEIYLEAMKLDHKSNTLEKRIANLTEKVSKLDSTNEQASLGELQMRKPFKSSMLVDQHTLDRSTLPVALAEVYSRCDPPPNLDALNPFRDPGTPSALSLYTNPSFFFDLWRQEMLKDCADTNARRRVKSPPPDGVGGVKSPKKRRQRVPPQQQEVPRQQAARYMSSLRNPRSAALSFPDEYQAPQALGLQLHKTTQIQHFQPAQTSTPALQQSTSSTRSAPSVESRQRATVSPPKEPKRELPPPDLALLSIDDEDEELPPPPPTLMHTSVVHHLPSPPPSAIQLVPSDAQAVVPPPPAPPPPPPSLMAAPAPAAATFGGAAKASTETEEEKKPDTRSNLLAEIQSGIKLKKVRLAEEAAADKAAAEANDVAAILKRRMEHVMGNDDEESQSSGDDGEWED